jgi:hypothetical protein
VVDVDLRATRAAESKPSRHSAWLAKARPPMPATVAAAPKRSSARRLKAIGLDVTGSTPFPLPQRAHPKGIFTMPIVNKQPTARKSAVRFARS